MVNYYKVLEVSASATEEQIKNAYRKLALKWHPDRNLSNRTAAEKKMREINEANEVLSDPEKKGFYDCHGDNWEYYFEKFKEKGGGGGENKGKIYCAWCWKEITDRKKWKNGTKDKQFCSEYHATRHWNWKHGIKEKCRSCGSDHKNTGVPERCEKIENIMSDLELLKNWELFTPDEQNYYFQKLKDSRVFPDDDFDISLRRTFERAKKIDEEKENEIEQERNSFIQKLKNLKGWEILSEKRQNEVIEEMKGCRNTSQFNRRVELVEKEIKKLQGDPPESEGDKNLSTEIQKAIQEIEAELNKEPKIIEKNEEWKNYIENSSNLTELKSRKQEILERIQILREQQGGGGNLTELRAYTIHLIKQELNKNPPVSTSELINPNWEEEINQAQTKDAIMAIKTQVLANIRNVRVVKGQKNHLNELILQAQQPENWGNYQNLENILKQIKELRSSDAYEKKAAEIQALENRLRELDPSQFKKSSQDSLDQQIKNNGLTDSNMDDETKKAIAEAKQDPSLEKIAKAEEKIAQNGADNNLNNLITKISNKLEKGNLTEKEKKELESELLKSIITGNKYQQAAYQKLKPRIDALLAKLKGENNNQGTPPISWPKILGIATLIALPLIIIIIIILRVRRRTFNRERNY